MQMVSPLRNSNVPEEHRHHARHRLTSTVYVELGPGNGGIIISLGTGGLSVHAAIKLNAEMELSLRFRLDPTEEPIEVAGRIAWLDATQKDAGISFKDLPADAERQIANWIAAQEQAVPIAQGELDPQPRLSSTIDAAPPISIQVPIAASRTAENFENTQPSLSTGIPSGVVSEPSQPAQFSNVAPALQRTTPSSPTIAFPAPEERLERPSDRLLRAPAKRYEILPKPASTPQELVPKDSQLPGYEVLLEPQKPAPATKETLPADSRTTSLMPSPAKVIEVSRQAPQGIEVAPQPPQANDSAASKLRQQRKLGFAVAACSAGILVLMVTLMSISKPPARHDSSGEPAAPISPAAAVEPASVPQIAPEALTDQAGAITPSEDLPPEAYYDLLPILPTHLPVTVAQGRDWSTQVEAMLGMDVGAKLNPDILALPVWTVRHSGYYYCVESLNSDAPQPGALMMQGEALQTGYRPSLGKYCN
jgi:PilZ domain-containing protein